MCVDHKLNKSHHNFIFGSFFTVRRQQMLLYQLQWLPGETCASVSRETTRGPRGQDRTGTQSTQDRTTRGPRERDRTGTQSTQDQRCLQATVSHALLRSRKLTWNKSLLVRTLASIKNVEISLMALYYPAVSTSSLDIHAV